MPGLVNLHALNIIHFRSEDTCAWVTRETRRFIIDTLVHYPSLKLEYLTIDNGHVERILRLPLEPNNLGLGNKHSKAKGKNKATNSLVDGDTSSSDSDLSSDSDEDTSPNGKFKMDTVPHMQFHDIWGIRIFEKEVVAGRL